MPAHGAWRLRFSRPQARPAQHGYALGRAIEQAPGPDLRTSAGSGRAGMAERNDPETLDVLRHLEAKVTARAAEMTMVARDLEDGAETLVVSYGITSRAAREAVRLTRASGRRASFLGLLTLFPIPADEIRAAAAGVRRVVVAEENMGGLYRRVLAGALPGLPLHGVNTLGAMIRPAQILEAV